MRNVSLIKILVLYSKLFPVEKVQFDIQIFQIRILVHFALRSVPRNTNVENCIRTEDISVSIVFAWLIYVILGLLLYIIIKYRYYFVLLVRMNEGNLLQKLNGEWMETIHTSTVEIYSASGVTIRNAATNTLQVR
mgnify:CR=1 FL=1